jgi:CelD/BcsL family acetyltransferase involved in cellulose biosynthesis
MTNTMTTCNGGTSTVLENLSLDAWQEMVESHTQSTPFHHRNWIELIQDQYQFPLHIPAIRQHGEVSAGLPFMETRTVLGRRKLIALPFTDCIRPLATDEQSEQTLINAICSNLPGGCQSTILRTDQHNFRAVSTSPWVRHTLDTSRPLDGVVGQFSSMLRRNIRRAQRRDLRFERRDDMAAVDEFYRLHLMTRRKLGVPIQPRHFFVRLHRWMISQGLGYVGVVTKRNEVIAAGIFLTYKQTVVYKYVASDPSALDHRPNEWLTYHAIREAVENDMAVFDFGSSHRNHQGLCRFKRKWGAVESDLFEYSLSGRECRSANKSGTPNLLASVIKHSPLFVCRGLGEIFYRYSP